MTEKEGESLVDRNQDSPSDFLSELQKLRSEILEVGQTVSSDSDKLRCEIFTKLNQLSNESEENKKIAERNHADNREKFQSIEDLISKIQPEAAVATKFAVVSPPVSSCLSNNPNSKTPEIGKSFVLRHVFKNVENFENDSWNRSELEEHFGVDWYICIKQKDSYLQFLLHVNYPGKDWEIETEFDLKIIGPKKTDFTKSQNHRFKESIGFGFSKFLGWAGMKRNYLVDGNLTTEVHVKISETKGLRKEKFRSFDESVKEVSDMVLVVKDKKFYVNKTFLAAQSSFFRALLLGSFAESNKSEITLSGIDPEDFNFFLEILYGEAAIDESNVEGIILLADMYDAPTAIRRCEQFMLEKSRKLLKRKLHMADRYNLDGLKKKCLSGIKTLSDVRSAVPSNFQDFDHSTVSALLEKAISFR